LNESTKTPRSNEHSKPESPLIGADSNIFNLMGIASRTLKNAGMRESATEMYERVTASGSFDEALAIIMDYVTPVAAQSLEAENDLHY